MAEHLRRRMAINDLHYTYRHLQRRLRVLAQHTPIPLGPLLADQHQRDSVILNHLLEGAARHGELPSPQLCEEARALIDDLHHAGLRRPDCTARMLAIIGALQRVRARLAKAWNHLLQALPAEAMPEFRAQAMHAQEQVVRQYNDLSVLARRLSGT